MSLHPYSYWLICCWYWDCRRRYFCGCGFVPWGLWFSSGSTYLHNSIKDLLSRVTLRQPAGGNDPRNNDPTMNKTQLYPESQHKCHPKSSKFRRSRRLHYWNSQVCYHRSLHHKLRESEQINLNSTGKQEEPHKEWEDKEKNPNERKGGSVTKKVK